MDKTKKSSFVTGAAILGIAGLLVKIIGAVYRIPLTNIVGSDGMAYYEVAYPYYSWLLVISSAGIPTAVSKLVSERIALGDGIGAKRVFKASLKLLFVIGIITSVLLFALSGSIAKLSNAEAAKYSFMALAPALFFVSIMCAYRGYLQGMQCMTGTAISQIAEQIFKLIFGFSLAYYFVKMQPDRPELAAMGALLGVSISELIALVIIYIYYRRNIRKGTLAVCPLLIEQRVKRGPTMKTIVKRLLIIAIPITIGASIMPITGIADSAFIINILEKKNLAAGMLAESDTLPTAISAARQSYTVFRSYVTTLTNMPAVLTLALSMSLVPAISEACARKDRNTVKNASSTGIKLAMLIGAPCAVGLFVIGGPVMKLLYSELSSNSDLYREAVDVMYYASIGVLFLALVQTLTGIIQGLNKPRVPVYFLAIGGAIKVISMLLLMNFTSLGIRGAALSTVLCYAFAGIADTIYLIKTAKLDISYIDTFIKPIFASVLMGLLVWGIYSLVANTGRTVVATMLSVVVGVIAYCILIIALHPLCSSDFDFIPKGAKLKKLFRVK